MFVGGDAFHSDLFYIIECRTESDRIGNVARARLKAPRYCLVSSLLEGDVDDHVAAALPRGHVLQHIQLSVNGTDPGGAEDLVPGENVEVAVEGLYVHSHVGDSLRAIDQDARAMTVGHFHHLARRCNRSEGIRHLTERNNLCAWAEQLLVFFENHFATIVHRRDSQASTFL